MTQFDKAFVLLSVHEKAMGHPKLKWLALAAMAELEGMEPKEEPKPKKVPVPEVAKKDPELDLGAEGVKRRV